MKPYYDDGTCVIYHGDCREVLPSLTADAVVTDPPYGTGLYATDTAVFTAALLLSLPLPVAVFGWPERLVELCGEARLVPDEWVTWWPTNAALRTSPVPCLAREVEAVAIFGDVRGFQHLRIREREDFYGPMVWLFDVRRCVERIDFRAPKGRHDPYRTFRWKHARKSLGAVRRVAFLDVDNPGWLFRLGRLYTPAPCGGYGWWFPRQRFIDGFINRNG